MHGYGTEGTDIDTAPALAAGHSWSSLLQADLIQGQGRTGPYAGPALFALVFVNKDFEDIQLIGEGLEGAHRAKQATLSPLAGQDGKYNHQTDKKRNEDDRLDQRTGINNGGKLGYGLKRAQPFAIDRR